MSMGSMLSLSTILPRPNNSSNINEIHKVEGKLVVVWQEEMLTSINFYLTRGTLLSSRNGPEIQNTQG